MKLSIAFCILLCLLLFHDSMAQRELASIRMGSSSPVDFQTFACGDTLYFTCRMSGEPYANMVRVNPDGSYRDIFIHDIPDASFWGVESARADLYFYYLSEGKKKATYIKAMRLNLKSGLREVLSNQILIQHPIVDLINQDEMLVVSRDRERNSLVLTTIRKDKVVREEEMVLPVAMAGLATQDFQVVKSGRTGWPAEAKAPALIYTGKDFIHCIYDNVSEGSSCIVTYDRASKSLQDKNILSNDDVEARFFLVDSLLFKMETRSDHFMIKVSQMLSGDEISRITINANDVSKVPVYYYSTRDGSKRVELSEKKLIRSSRGRMPVVLARAVSPGVYSVTYGTFFDEKGIGTPVGFGSTSMIFAFLVTTAIQQARKGPGISYYNHTLLKDGKFEAADQSLVFEKIDAYEMLNKGDFKTVDYLIQNPRSGFLLRYGRLARKLQVIRFD